MNEQVLKEKSTGPLSVFTEDEQMIKDASSQFAKTVIAPLVYTMEKQAQIDPGLIRECFDHGLMGIEIPGEYGGAGGTFFMCILAIEEIAKVDGSVSVFMDVQNTLVNNAFIHWGSEAIKKKYLNRLAGSAVGAYALSEPWSGSDAFSLKARARKDGDGYVLNGTKLWITNGAEAEIFIVFANLNPEAGHRGITAFVVEKDFEGFTAGRKEDKLGIRASSTTELIMEDCRVPAGNILATEGKGYKVAMETLNEGRIGIGAQMTGIAQGAFEAAVSYCKERRQFGSPLSGFQAMQFQLAEMATWIETARLLVYNTARLKMAGQPFLKEAAMAKYYSSAIAEKVTSAAVEIFGGYGYVKDYPVEKYYRDAKIGKIYEGTSFMQLQTIAKALLAE
ncbi:MAG: acyl-CoA dehydrogenase [Balneolales bacterium]